MIVVQFVVGVVTICVISVSFFVLCCTLIEIGGRIDSKTENDTERFWTGLIAVLVPVMFVIFALAIGDIAMKFLGIRG